MDEDKIEFQIRNNSIYEKLTDHAQKYGHLTYGTSGPGNTVKDYIRILAGMARQDFDPKEIINTEKKKVQAIQQEISRLKRELELSAHEIRIFKTVRDSIWMKTYRKDHFYLWIKIADRIFIELGRRKNLSLEQMRMLTTIDVEQQSFNPISPSTVSSGHTSPTGIRSGS